MQERRLGSRYVLVEALGRGAMGQVYRARVESPRSVPDEDGSGRNGPGGFPQTEPDVAVKLLRDDLGGDPDLVHRFLTEGRLLKSVRHPNVVGILDLVAEGDQLAIVMDLVSDGDLRRAVAMPCPEADAARIVAGIADGLAAVHAADITHRDLKPENVLVERHPDGTLRPRISDFGVSRFSSATLTNTRGMTGTVGYIAPEVAEGGPATPASDVYCLGVILFELCAGHGPFRAENPIALIRAHAQDPVTRPAGMSDPMWEFVETLLAKDPSRRPTSQETAERARAVALGLPSGTGLPAATPPTTDLPVAAPPTSQTAPPTVHHAPARPAPVLPQLPQPPQAVTAPSGSYPPRDSYAQRNSYPPPAPAPKAHRRRPVAYVAAGVAAVLLVGGFSWALWSPRSGGNATAIGWADPADSTTTPPPSTTVAGASQTRSASSSTATPRGDASESASGRPASGRTTTTSTTATRPMSPRVTTGTTTTATTSTTSTSTTTTDRTGPSAGAATADPRAGTVPLYRYVNASNGDHFYTTNHAELGDGGKGYAVEGIQAYVYPSATTGTVPLYRYFNAKTGDHFYTTNHAELGDGGKGYAAEGVQAYVYPSATTGAVPLHRYFNAKTGDHFYTTNYAELGGGKSGYVYEGVCAYVR